MSARPRTMRVCLIADMLAEGWASMDLYADMLLEYLGREDKSLSVELFRLPLIRRIGRITRGRNTVIDRLAGRHLDYPRALRRTAGRADIYHIIDQTYAASVRAVSQVPTVVTCHDLDAFMPLTSPRATLKSSLLARLAKRTLSGVTAATHVVCVSHPIQRDLIGRGWQVRERTTVIPNGVDPHCSPAPSPDGDSAAASLFHSVAGPTILHVGSTIDRKRIDTLLAAFAAVRRARPDATLVKAGGQFTAEQLAQIELLDLGNSITVLTFLNRSTLAAVYRRATLAVLPSEREGFGLPVIEALACGTPVVASDIEVLREIGAAAVSYAPVGDVASWATTIVGLLNEHDTAPHQWSARIQAGLSHAANYSWSRHARELAQLYRKLIQPLA